MATLREMKEEGRSITPYCLSGVGNACHHSWSPSWDQLIQYFGPDFDLAGDRAPFAKLVCERCGGRGASVIVNAADIEHRAAGGHRHGPDGVSFEEATRRYHEFAAGRRRLGIKTNAEANAASRAKRRAEEKAAKAGADFIGPPNPWAHRKRGRWS